MKIKTLITLLALSVSAVQAQTKSINICIGKKGKVFQAKNQLSHLIVNGVTSRRSTFWYKGQHSKLALDFDKANVVAKCFSAGTDLYKFQISINGRSKMHKLLGSVTCIQCLPPKIINLKTKLLKLGKLIAKTQDPKKKQKLREQMLKITNKIIQEVNKQLKSEFISLEFTEQLEHLKSMLQKLQEVIAEGAIDSELFYHYLAQL